MKYSHCKYISCHNFFTSRESFHDKKFCSERCRKKMEKKRWAGKDVGELVFKNGVFKTDNKIEMKIYNDPGVYFLIYEDEIVYIGSSRCVSARVGAHVSRGEMEFDRVFLFLCKDYLYMERVFIGKYNPKYNERSRKERSLEFDPLGGIEVEN